MFCPLGFDIIEARCPNAPCLTCMRNMGDGILREMHRTGVPPAAVKSLLQDKLEEMGLNPTTRRSSYAEAYFQECAENQC